MKSIIERLRMAARAEIEAIDVPLDPAAIDVLDAVDVGRDVDRQKHPRRTREQTQPRRR